MIKYDKNLTVKQKKKIYDAIYCKKHKIKRGEYSKIYYKNNQSKSLAYSKKYQKEHPEETYKRRYCWGLIKYYGINIIQYNEMFEKQEGNCIICGINQKELNRPLCVDHDHNTKKVRGLLCRKCNMMIGYANDNIILLQKAIKYLKKNNKV